MFLAAASFPIWSILLSLLVILGSLGVFLFGMKVMSEGVQKVAGQRMRAALAGMTANRFRGIFTGFFLTSLVQSSSATTVLVVSFVNAGLLTLVESIGVIMGANLGTTITAWIVALIGKFNVSTVALPVIGIGLPFLFIGKDKGRSWGEVLIGFGLIFFGLGLLKDSVPDVRTMIVEDPETAHLVENIVGSMTGHGFGSLLLFLVGGIALTLLVQSSSAAMAITMTCALNGWLGDIEADPLGVFQNSAAIVLGENIGTTVTAWLAALGANTTAKRAARAHFLFNVIGVCWMLAAFPLFTAAVWELTHLLPSGLRSAEQSFLKSEVAFATAIFHSSFNLVNMLLLVAFVPQIARLVQWWVKDRGEPARPQLRYLSRSMVDLGELNLAEAELAISDMARLTSTMFDGFTEVLEQPGTDLGERVTALKEMENTSDTMLHDITAYLIQCSAHEIGSGNAEKVAAMLRVTSEFEEATDRIYRLVKAVQRKYQQGRDFSDHQHRELRAIAAPVRAMLDLALNALTGITRTTLETATGLEDEVDALRKRNNRESAQRMQSGALVPTELIFTEINNHLEAVANHALNIMQNCPRAAFATP
jgi:phosphate:Na+ symporter